jgi:hypothetical protein
LTHRLISGVIDGEHFAQPETERAMLLERGHIAQNAAAIFKERHAPLHGLGRLGTMRVDEVTEVREDRPGEVGGFGNVCINAGILDAHGHALKKV